MPIDLTPIVKPVNDVAEPITNSLSDAWSAVLGDKIAAWRLRNAAATQAKLHEELKRMGVSLNHAKIPERYAFAWFEEATKQDEPEIQELFARLLAKAAAGDNDAGDRRNLEILTRMMPMDAEVMQLIFSLFGDRGTFRTVSEYRIWAAVRKEFGEEGELCIEHLIQLGVVEQIYGISSNTETGRYIGLGGDVSMSAVMGHVQANTDLACDLAASNRGKSLFAACQRAPDGKPA